MIARTNVEDRLRKHRSKDIPKSDLLAEVKNILDLENHKDESVYNKLQSQEGISQNSFNIDLLDTDRIYHVEHIKAICIDYRLRFLDSELFKGSIPYEAIMKIKALNKEHGIELSGFKIMAPSKLFKLENADDPLLFAPIGNDYYYLIHKWGNDLSPFRKLAVLPFKNKAMRKADPMHRGGGICSKGVCSHGATWNSRFGVARQPSRWFWPSWLCSLSS